MDYFAATNAPLQAQSRSFPWSLFGPNNNALNMNSNGAPPSAPLNPGALAVPPSSMSIQNDPHQDSASMKEGGSDLEPDFNRRALLPASELITEAFNNLSNNFTVSKILQEALQNPLATVDPNLRKELDAVNLMLETNVQKLFSPASPSDKEDITNIKLGLLSLLSRSDALLTQDKQKQDEEEKIQTTLSRIKKLVTRFYKHLLQLIKALLAYNAIYESQLTAQSNDHHAFVFRAWMQVLGYLQSIRSVITFASKEQLLDLESHPVNFEEVIKRMEGEKMALKQNIYLAQGEIIALNNKLLEQKVKRKELDDAYKGMRAELASKTQQVFNMNSHLEAFTNPAKIAQGNIRDLTPEGA